MMFAYKQPVNAEIAWSEQIVFSKEKVICVEIDGSTDQVRWRFEALKSSSQNYCIKCFMSFGDFIAEGFSSKVSLKTASIVAFAEAWERMVMKITKFPSAASEISSNGFAAGPTESFAKAKAVAELKERHIFMQAWQNMNGWNSARTPVLLRPILSGLEKKGWEFSYFVIHHIHNGNVLAALARHQNFGALFDVKYLNNGKPDTSNFIDITLPIIYNANLINTSETFSQVDYSAVPMDHYDYYRNSAHLEAFSFLDDVKRSTEVSQLSGRLLGSTIEFKVFNFSNELPVVVQAYCADWPAMQWGRQSAKGRNEWLHPLA